ncbi:hypothetical protein DAI22_06g146900 [Oryza sativa Japonica Group]|nr:hypothetical protein DAI22_06g146900 [Oryza sativa Japonica Group]
MSWARRTRSAELSPAAFSDDVAGDARSLLRRYKERGLVDAGLRRCHGRLRRCRSVPCVEGAACRVDERVEAMRSIDPISPNPPMLRMIEPAIHLIHLFNLILI